MQYSRFLKQILFFSLLFCAPSAIAVLPTSMSHALGEAGIPESSVAVFVQPVTETKPLLAHQADFAMNPASVMKLLTTYAALEILGPAYTWKTEASHDGTLRNGELRGNLYIKGSGDPKLTVEQLWLFLKRVRAAGVHAISGDVVLDASFFVPMNHDPGVFDDKPIRAYNVGPDALLINFNAINISLAPDANGDRVNIWAEPNLTVLKLINKVALDGAPCGDWKERIDIEVSGNAKVRQVKMTGKFSNQCGEKNYPMSLFDHQNFARNLFVDLWREMGGKVKGRVRSGAVPEAAKVVARLDSAALSDVIRDMNKWSNNVMARQIYLTLGAATQESPASLDKSNKAVYQWLSEKRLNFPELVVENGSGLSRFEKISARHMADLLISGWASPMMPELIASLPVIAIDGTMRKRFQGNPLAGRAHIKTGSLEGVKTMAGYVLDKNGRVIVVVSFINDPKAGFARIAEDALIAWIYNAGY